MVRARQLATRQTDVENISRSIKSRLIAAARRLSNASWPTWACAAAMQLPACRRRYLAALGCTKISDPQRQEILEASGTPAIREQHDALPVSGGQRAKISPGRPARMDTIISCVIHPPTCSDDNYSGGITGFSTSPCSCCKDFALDG